VKRTTSDGPDFVPVADRIAAFDDDGTLWVELPLPPQFDFVFRTRAEEIKQNPAMAGEQPYKAIIEKDPAFFQGVATQDPEVIEALLNAFVRSWAGTTPAEFDAQVDEWLATVKQPKLGVPYRTWSTSRCSSCSTCSRRTASRSLCARAAAGTTSFHPFGGTFGARRSRCSISLDHLVTACEGRCFGRGAGVCAAVMPSTPNMVTRLPVSDMV
jgi:hypothetical protein